MPIYTLFHSISGRIRSLQAASWAECEQQLRALNLDPDLWGIGSITEELS